ncbi:MAG: hypothetical protein HFG31_02160 [Eubacterium sp.]|nr:hypothetical protein [Eubacterium sp.]
MCDTNHGYELVTRGIYYTAGEKSPQYSREFTNFEYNNIKKFIAYGYVSSQTGSEQM